MTRSLGEDMEMFVARIRKTHPGITGVAIGLAYPNGHIAMSYGDFHGKKTAICNAIRRHEDQPFEEDL